MTDTITLQKPRERIRVKLKDIFSYLDNAFKLMDIVRKYDVGNVCGDVIVRQSSREGVAYLYLPVNEQSDALIEELSKLEYVTLVEKGRGIF